MILGEKFKSGLWTLSFDLCGKVEEATGKTREATIDVMHATIKTTLPEVGSVWLDANNAEHQVKSIVNAHTCRVVCEGGEVALVDWHYDMQLLNTSVTKNIIMRMRG